MQVNGHRRRARFVALATALLLVAAGCSDEAGDADGEQPSATSDAARSAPAERGDDFNQAEFEGQPRAGGSITIGVWDQVGRLDPAGPLAGSASIGPALAIYDPLIGRDPEGGFAPSLATRWTASGDLTTYTVHLRDGVTFQDGAPFDSAAVVTHFDYLRNPDAQCVCAQDIAEIASVDATDPTTVVFHLTAPDASFLSFLAGTQGLILSPKAIAAAHLEYGTEYGPKPVGTGPFSLAGTDPVVLKKNPDYWGADDDGRTLPYLDQIEVRTIADEGERLAALRKGDIDLMQTVDNDSIVAAAEAGLDVQKVVGASARMLVFNTRRPPFDDVRARRAVAMSIDRDAINEAAYEGTHLPAVSPFAYRSRLRGDVEWPAFDLDAAKDLVDEVEADGGIDPVTANCIATDEQRAVYAEIAREAAAAGLAVENEFEDSGPFVNRIFGSRDFSMACFGGVYELDADDLYITYHSGGTNNMTGYSNPTVDAALEAVRATNDDAEQRRLVKVVLEKLAEDVPAVPLTYELNANIHRDDLSGLPAPEVAWLGTIRFTTLYRRT
jgi:peptide/nickel transport system substrate-binding protein